MQVCTFLCVERREFIYSIVGMYTVPCKERSDLGSARCHRTEVAVWAGFFSIPF